ncbi:MAG: hypothetical protein IPJ98_26900 [Bryobacterales bacterium]|nr:hypothetical protein [Bryobacterales bacterium]
MDEREAAGGIRHFRIGVEGNDARRMATARAAQSHKSGILTEAAAMRFRVPPLAVGDPDGIRVHFSITRYRGEMPAPK